MRELEDSGRCGGEERERRGKGNGEIGEDPGEKERRERRRKNCWDVNIYLPHGERLEIFV